MIVAQKKKISISNPSLMFSRSTDFLDPLQTALLHVISQPLLFRVVIYAT